MLKAILYQQWLKVILFALVGLILYGVFPGTALAVVLLLFVGLRLTSLAAEALGRRPPLTPSDTDQLDETPVALPPRNRWELIAEACGALTYGIAIPLALALTTHDFFSARLPQDWRSALIVALALCLYAWPLRLLSSPRFAPLRIGWWAGPFLPAFFLVHHAITTRHPYLNPFAADHTQRAAEQVLGLKNNIMAGRHADWVLAYARQLETRGDSKRAAELYHATLRLDPVNQAAVERLAVLEPRPTYRGIVGSRGSSSRPLSAVLVGEQSERQNRPSPHFPLTGDCCGMHGDPGSNEGSIRQPPRCGSTYRAS